LSIWLLAALSQSSAQAPQRDNRPRAASIGGRVTIAGNPALNAVITLAEIDLKPDAADGSDAPILHQSQTMTDGDGRYLFSGLAKGRYIVRAMLNAFVVADSSGDPAPRRTVILDEGEAQEKIDFALIRGGVITGRVMDGEGAPLIAQLVQLYAVDEQGQKREYRGHFTYVETFVTDDRGVYRIYGLPPGRYIISAGGDGEGDQLSGGGGKFARTYHPHTTDEEQAGVIEIKEGREVTDVDISARKTYFYEAAGRVVDKETGKPVPEIHVSCWQKPEKGGSNSIPVTGDVTDGQGNFKFPLLRPGRYVATVTDSPGIPSYGYTSEAAEFEIADDNVSGVEVKASPGARVSGFVVIEGAAAAARDQLQSLEIYPCITLLGDATDDANDRFSITWSARFASVNTDGSFVLEGLTGRVSFILAGSHGWLQIKRIERDGVEAKDAIEVRTGENIAGIRIVAYQPQGRIRGEVQIAGGALPDGWRLAGQLAVNAGRPAPADEAKSAPHMRMPIVGTDGYFLIDKNGRFVGTDGYLFIDESGRFVIEGLPAGEYDLSITLINTNPDRIWEPPVSPPGSNQRVTIRENEETPVTITIDLSDIKWPQQQEKRQ
jgi:protocatechuate 3,4-dioxygenase beta subunit